MHFLIKDGSVVEYSYTVLSPFIHDAKNYDRRNVPIIYSEYVFDALKRTVYNINYQGSVLPKYRVVEEKCCMVADYRTYRFGYENIKSIFRKKIC